MRNGSRAYRKVENPEGTFSTRICTDCAYRVGQSCSMCGGFIRYLDRCPDGYTVELCQALSHDSIVATLTGKHTEIYYKWKPKRPNAKYPEKDRSIEDEFDFDEYLNA